MIRLKAILLNKCSDLIYVRLKNMWAILKKTWARGLPHYNASSVLGLGPTPRISLAAKFEYFPRRNFDWVRLCNFGPVQSHLLCCFSAVCKLLREGQPNKSPCSNGNSSKSFPPAPFTHLNSSFCLPWQSCVYKWRCQFSSNVIMMRCSTLCNSSIVFLW